MMLRMVCRAEATLRKTTTSAGPDLIDIRRFPVKSRLIDWTVQEIGRALKEGIAARRHAVFVASGGRGPGPILAALARLDLDWSRVTVTLSDERWVRRDSPLSNERMVRGQLLRGRARTARLIGLRRDQGALEDGVEQGEEVLAALPHPFDVALLGMGLDGHVASLFSEGTGADVARESDRMLAAVTPSPLPFEAPYPRITMTLNTLAAIKRILLLAADDRKVAILEGGGGRRPTEMLPVIELGRRAGARLTAVWSPRMDDQIE